MTAVSGNPFIESSSAGRPPAALLVIFGGTGDLAHRKLLPALYDLSVGGYLPDQFSVLGLSRKVMNDDEYRASLKESVRSHARRSFSEERWQNFGPRIFYQAFDLTLAEGYAALGERLQTLSGGPVRRYIYYFATAPRFFKTIAANLKRARLVQAAHEDGPGSAAVVEKPFGRDLLSAQELNRTLRGSFEEQQIFRIDHYLAKETIQNILVFRFANGVFEPFWNNRYIDHIQIALCEQIGVGGRAEYFEQAGLLRDIVQNHLLQVLALLCIEPPVSLASPEAIREEKVKVLRSVKRLSSQGVKRAALRAQYTEGFINGEAVPGYRREVGQEAAAETYVALRLEIDNWRWAGVPIYLRAGKRLPKPITEIAVFFKQPPATLFESMGLLEPEQNVLTIQVQPRESIALRMNSKPPGLGLDLKPVEMEFTYRSSFGLPSPDAYERLLLDVMRGDASLFTRDDEIEQAWEIVSPLLAAWSREEDTPPMYSYAAGGWGPREARELIAAAGRRWRRL